ncbi:BadF/BadG/BcrA/BcrD ATPase family protein [Amaricoccus macauensis]|uniref:BadF/BadG/BcrA/BcrD ATPase family protein n=1 Tax=Amaricoccus macauensis TaxID=57001 RepID=UPI003C7AE2EC
MSDSGKPMVIGIDGGGTRCRLALDCGPSVAVVEAGPANVSSNFDATVREILNGLDALAGKTGMAFDALTNVPAFIGLAGMTSAEIADQLRMALPLARVRIEDDRPAAVRGVLGARDGALAHCGTGTFFAAQVGGQMRVIGGWGPVLADEASAQWVGRRALRVALDQADGLFAPSGLSARLLSEYGGTGGIVAFAGRATPAEFGALAPLVTQGADSGDALAMRIMEEGAARIAHTLPQIGWTPGLPLCLTGGIGPHFARFLPMDMQAGLAEPKGQPLDGALALARDLAREISDGRH